MSFIDKFLDITTNLVRVLNLYKLVEERAREINDNLKNAREKYLKNIKDKNNESMLNTIDAYYKQLLNLSDYKQSLLDELKFILEKDFLNKLEPIIEEGKKERQEQLQSSNINFLMVLILIRIQYIINLPKKKKKHIRI